jgi:hypothetical protein
MQHYRVDQVKVIISWSKWDIALRALECANKPS